MNQNTKFTVLNTYVLKVLKRNKQFRWCLKHRFFLSKSLIQDKKEKVFLIDHFKITFIVYSFMLIVFFVDFLIFWEHR